MTATVGRRQARRTALFLLYQWDLTGQPLTTLYEGTPDAFAVELAEAVSARAAELDARITEAAEGWTADRLGTLERNILRIAIHELDGETRAGGGGDQRGGRAGEALRLGGRRAARERDPRACGQGADGGGRVSGNETEAALGRAEELLERLKTTREELERLAAAENAEAAVEVLTELAELAKQVEVELAKARAQADRPSQPDASS